MFRNFAGKRELLARALFWSGAAAVLRALPERNGLLVLNYHRIGDPLTDMFDPGVFSATQDQFDAQLAFLKRHCSLVALDEAVAFIEGSDRAQTRRCRVLITFDDGYLDNFQLAFPVLRTYAVQGVFFLASGLVGSCTVPWWDRIAYLVKTASHRRFRLNYPDTLDIDLDANGLTRSLDDVLALYKRPGNTDSARFLTELLEAAEAKDPPAGQRRFLDWNEARTMLAGGMAVGSHTHSHSILSQLDRDAQYHELSHSRAQFKDHLGIDANTIAYPVGAMSSFSAETQRVARECGYRAGFSFYEGVNTLANATPYDIRRVGVGYQSSVRFRVQASACMATGHYWP